MVVRVAAGSALVLLPTLGVVLAGAWAAIAVTVKRFHDLDRPGWHGFLRFLPLYNIVLGLQLVFQKGTLGPNRYGRDPLQIEAASAHLLD